jgi:hypothetical protein
VNLDRDLPDALRPLAGDPVADASRILAALPPGPPGGPQTGGPQTGGPGPRQRPAPEAPAPMQWWLLAGGFALGLAGGFVLGWLTSSRNAPERVEVPVGPGQPPDEQPPDQKQPDERPPDQKQPIPDMRSDHLLLMAFGALTVDEPDKGRQELTPGGWKVAARTTFTTAEARAGIYAYPSDLQVRLDEQTVAMVASDHVALTEGRVWLYTGGSRAAARIEADPVTVLVEGGAAMVTRAREGVGVVACRGPLNLRTANGAARRLLDGQRIWFDSARGFGDAEAVPFMPAETSWMTQMILQQQDETELRERVVNLVAAWEQGTHRAAAAREIRKLGSRCVPMLVYGIEQRHGDAATLRETAALVAQIVDHHDCRFAAHLLLDDDAEIRVAAFRGVARASGEDFGTDEAFWRDADPTARAEKQKAWLAALRR